MLRYRFSFRKSDIHGVNFLSMRTAVPPARPSDNAADGSIIFFRSGKIFAPAAWGAVPAAYQQNHFCSFMQNAA
jgi:hypothetical protein